MAGHKDRGVSSRGGFLDRIWLIETPVQLYPRLRRIELRQHDDFTFNQTWGILETGYYVFQSKPRISP
jgi:hypothetical protein